MENKTKTVTIEIPVGKDVVMVDGVLTLVDNVTERIKTFADACRELGSEHPYVKAYDGYVAHVHHHNMDDYDLLAYLKLRIITEALNEGWKPEFTKDEHRWGVVYNFITKEEYERLDDEYKTRILVRGGNSEHSLYGVDCKGLQYGIATLSTGFDCSHVLVFKSKELAVYAGKQFVDIAVDFCFKPKTNE